MTDIVQQMFDEAGITPQRPDKNVFLTVIDGVYCSFRTILKCDEDNPNKLFIYAPFPIPVPKHIAGLIPHELNLLNENNKYKSEIALQENGDEYYIFTFTDCEFEDMPSTDEIKDLINVADDVERDILRKLLYLVRHKKSNSDNDADSIQGRLEAISMIDKDKYSLLYEV